MHIQDQLWECVGTRSFFWWLFFCPWSCATLVNWCRGIIFFVSSTLSALSRNTKERDCGMCDFFWISICQSIWRVWLFVVAVGIAFIFVLPTGIVQAVTNQTIGKPLILLLACFAALSLTSGLNVITEFVAGLVIPGDPLANVTFKTYGYITQYQALLLISDLKLGHYMKVWHGGSLAGSQHFV